MAKKRGKPTTRKPRRSRLLSDYAALFLAPPDAPTKQTKKVAPPEPTTAIPELRILPLTPFSYQTVAEAVTAAGQVQHKKLNPKGGANLRYRIELAAVFLADVIGSAYEAGLATGYGPDELVDLSMELVIRRAQEIYGQDGA
jgi:hypothetical protein